MSQSENLDQFLKPTEFIDSDNSEIIAKAKELTEGCSDEKERL